MFFLALMLFMFGSDNNHSQDETTRSDRKLRAAKITEKIVVDGKLDEPAIRKLAGTAGYQWRPDWLQKYIRSMNIHVQSEYVLDPVSCAMLHKRRLLCDSIAKLQFCSSRC
jgi:hypothetical protein